MKQLDNLVRIGKLKVEPPTRGEFDGLIRSGRARLNDAETAQLSEYGRFDLAYNAAHALALAALRRAGYRSESRYLVFQCLEHTLNLPKESWRVLDQAHNKRNIAEYSGDSEIDAELLAALMRVARDLEHRVSQLAAPDP
jgi:Rad3-related DNA helicase